MRPRQAERHHLFERALHRRGRKQRQRVDGHRAVVLGAVDGILKGAVLAHQADRVIEIVLANLAPLQRLDPESALAVIAAAERQHYRQRDLALAEIVADVLAELGGLAAVVEHIVDQLERDAEIHADRTACGLLRLRAVGDDGPTSQAAANNSAVLPRITARY